MLSSPRSIRPLHHPTAWALSHTSKPSLLVLSSSSNVQTLYRCPNIKISSRRSFYWGKRRQRGYSNGSGLYNLYESRSRSSKDGSCSSLYHKYFNNLDHSIYRYLSGHGWGRSGYGRSSCKPSESDKPNTNNDYWYKSFQEKQAAIEKEFEDFKKMVDADPYGMLFGFRHPYSPWRSADKSKNENSNGKEGNSGMKGRQHDDKGASTAKPTDEGQVQEHASQPPPHPEVKASSKQETEVEEYEFDPITMRKVLKRPARPAPAFMHKRTEPKSEYNIPVKPFVATGPGPVESSAHPQARPRNEAPRTKQPGQKWLTQEGFGAGSIGLEKPGSRSQQQSEHVHSTYPKIETALNRHLRTKGNQAEESSTNHPPLRSKDEENTTEDIDLLRASDIRASAGLGGKSPKETYKKKQERQKTLENDYERRPQYLDARLRDEVASRKAQAARSPIHGKRSPIHPYLGYHGPSVANSVDKNRDCEPTLSNVSSEERSEQLAEISRREALNRKKAAAKNVHEGEVKAQKAAMEALEMHRGIAEKTDKVLPVHSQESGEGDMASNVHEFVGRSRWYKQRAPHAMKDSDLKLEQIASDRALVREIRSIYEVAYGTIDTQHRQPSRQAEREEKEHTQDAMDHYLKQASMESEPKANLRENREAIDQLRQSSFRALPDRLRGAFPDGLKPNSISERPLHKTYNFETIGFQPRHLLRKIERNNKEQAQEVNQYEKPSPRALPDMSDAISSSSYSAKPQHAEKQELERPEVSKVTPKLVNESGVELPTSADMETKKPDGSTLAPSSSSDGSGLSSTSKPISPEASDSTKPSSYRILAYDPSTQRVTSAKTTSLATPTDEKTLSLVEALSRLAAPAKFLPHFASLQNSGYEIVSGSTNVLIFKKVRPAKPASHAAEESPSTTIDEKYPRHTNPIDGTTTQTGNFASPTGFVNHDAILPPSEDGQPMGSYSWSSKPNDKVTRQEEVFSGSRPRWDDHRAERMSKRLRNKQRKAERRKRTLKRMVWVGVWVAGCCYAVGVGVEFLRT